MINDFVESPEFKSSICKHYHGDYGTLYFTATGSGLTFWQCACGYRTVSNEVIADFILKDLIDDYLSTLSKECKDSPNHQHNFITEDFEDFWDMHCQWCYKDWNVEDDNP